MAQNARQRGLPEGSTSSKPGVWETNQGARRQVPEQLCVQLQLSSCQPGQDTRLRVSGPSPALALLQPSKVNLCYKFIRNGPRLLQSINEK